MLVSFVRFALLVAGLLAFLGLVNPPAIHAQKNTAYFYKALPYGSMSLFTPWNLIINGSYDVLQLDGRNREILNLPYEQGFKNVFRNTFIHPGATIGKLGFGRWITTEILPLNFTVEGAQWLPNYQLHLIGGGMSYRMLSEWYDYHDIAYPKLFAGFTLMSYHLLNEAVENESYAGYNSDPIADLLVFDLLGIALFSSDSVAGFFANTLNMTDWSNLAMITVPSVRLGTNGLYYSLKWHIPDSKKWSIWSLMGTSNMFGLSYKIDGENSITLGGGARGTTLDLVNAEVRLLTLALVPTGGIFWDRNNSLMASLTASGQTDQSIILNLYPDVVHLGDLRPAIWATYGTNNTFGLGTAVVFTIGAGYRNQ